MADTDDLSLLARGAVTLPVGAWDVLRAQGSDRVRFLHGLLTADIQAVPPGQGVRACLLDAKGHVVSDLHVLVRAEDILLVVAGGQGAVAAAAISRYAIMDDCQIDFLADWAVLPVLGPLAHERLKSAAGARFADLGGGAAIGDAALSHRAAGTLTACRVREGGAWGVWIVGPSTEVAEVGAALVEAGVPQLRPEAAEAARIAAGEPAWGREISSARFPLEVGLGSTIAYGKGCYLGQEPIVRIRDRGHVNWLLRTLTFAGEVVPEPGDEIEHESRAKAGTVTSAARTADGRGVALALVHASITAPTHVAIRRGERLIPAALTATLP